MSETPSRDPWTDWIQSRFESIEQDARDRARRMAVLEKDVADGAVERGVLGQQVGDMIDAFKAFRTALYTAACLILVAAMTVVLLGHP